jgi:hypothetical protein
MFFHHISVSRTLSLSGMILSGTLLGFYWQRMADSGDLQMPKILLTCAISVGSYLIAFFVVETFKIQRDGWQWVLSSFIGSVLSAFNIKVVRFLIVNAQDPFSPSFLEQLDLVAFGFLACAVFFSAISLLIVATIHLLGRSLERLFTS